MAVDDGFPVLLFSSPIERMQLRTKRIQSALSLEDCVRLYILSRHRALRLRALHSASNHGDKGQWRVRIEWTGRNFSSCSAIVVSYNSKSSEQVRASLFSRFLNRGWSRRAAKNIPQN